MSKWDAVVIMAGDGLLHEVRNRADGYRDFMVSWLQDMFSLKKKHFIGETKQPEDMMKYNPKYNSTNKIRKEYME